MKYFSSAFVILIILAPVVNYGCAPHCDDEDYAKDQKNPSLHKTDTLAKEQID